MSQESRMAKIIYKTGDTNLPLEVPTGCITPKEGHVEITLEGGRKLLVPWHLIEYIDKP